MHASCSGGVPVNYSPAFATSDQRSCATQSAGGSTDVSSVDSFYTPSPTLPLAETTLPPSHSHSQSHSHLHLHSHSNSPSQPQPNQSHPHQQPFSTASLGTAVFQTYPHQHPQIDPSDQSMWLTPPATSCDDFDSYSYQGSPTNTNCAIQSAPPCSAPPSVTSPKSWASPDAQQLNLQPAIWDSNEPISSYPLQANTPAQHEDAFQQQPMTATSPYTGTIYPGANLGNADNIMQDAPTVILDVPEPNSGFSPPDESPQMKNEFSDNYHTDEKEPPRGPATIPDVAKPEPYAKLMFRAFLAAEGHRMTLKELYQWFKDNTDKVKGGGWQNSIRHNLSMNAAFVKPRPGDSPGGKKSNEWILEDWAIREGIQSTTRYRKDNTNRRGGSSHQRVRGNPSARASSGRKGGIAASRTKAAATRKALARRAHNPPFCIDNGQRDAMQTAPFYDQRNFGYSYTPSSRGLPITPPDVNAGDIVFPHTVNATALSNDHPNQPANQGYMYHSTLLQHGPGHRHGGYPQHQHHQQQPLPQLPTHHHNQQQQQTQGHIYTLDDISGVFQGQDVPTSLPGRAGQDMPTSTISAGYNALFTDTDTMNEDEDRVASRLALFSWSNSGASAGAGAGTDTADEAYQP